MAFRVPAKCCHAVAQLDAAIDQRIRNLLGLFEKVGICRADNIAFDPAGDDFPCRVDAVGVFQNLVNRKRPILHDAQHDEVSLCVLVFSINRLI